MDNPAFWFGMVIGMVLQTLLYLCYLKLSNNQVIITTSDEEPRDDPADWWKGRM